jgi:hypothetical protein
VRVCVCNCGLSTEHVHIALDKDVCGSLNEVSLMFYMPTSALPGFAKSRNSKGKRLTDMINMIIAPLIPSIAFVSVHFQCCLDLMCMLRKSAPRKFGASVQKVVH